MSGEQTSWTNDEDSAPLEVQGRLYEQTRVPSRGWKRLKRVVIVPVLSKIKHGSALTWTRLKHNSRQLFGRFWRNSDFLFPCPGALGLALDLEDEDSWENVIRQTLIYLSRRQNIDRDIFVTVLVD